MTIKYLKNLTLLNILILLYLIVFKKQNLIINQPKISVIIPVYNGEKYLNYTLRSVFEQNIKDIEIIIIDDNSIDESLKLIKNYMKKDKRINLIKNNENRKILFCKSFAALNSKGKYIFEIDQDDKIIGNYTFSLIYNESENNGLDLLHFNYISGYNIFNKSINANYSIQHNIIYLQPKLKLSVFQTNRCVLWGNLIKTDLYKKVIYNLWPIIINYKIIFQEDFLVTFFMLIYAKKFKRISNVFYYYFKNINQASIGHKNNLEYYLSVIFVGIIFYDYYIDMHSKDLPILINYINYLKLDFIRIHKLYPELFNYFFGKILTNNQLIQENKYNIIRDFNISEKSYSNFFWKINKSNIYNELTNMKNNNNINYIFSKNMFKLSIIIVFSHFDKVKNLINSLKKQYVQFFEIILIFDGENKTENFLNSNFNKIFTEIKLIKNEFKKGILYSILEGVEIAKGKYLMILNPNCFFLDKDVIQKLFIEIEIEEFDILEFNLFKILSNNYVFLYKCKHFHSQFNLTNIKYNLDFNDIDIQNDVITNKLFKTIYFKNIIKHLKNSKFTKIVDFYYNDIFSFLIDSNHHNFKRSNKINIYINDNDCKKFNFNEFNKTNKNLIKETIIYIDFIFNNSKNTYESKQKILKEFFNHLSIIFNKFTKLSDISLKLLNQFYNCKYIPSSNKTLLKFYFNSLIN